MQTVSHNRNPIGEPTMMSMRMRIQIPFTEAIDELNDCRLLTRKLCLEFFFIGSLTFSFPDVDILPSSSVALSPSLLHSFSKQIQHHPFYIFLISDSITTTLISKKKQSICQADYHRPSSVLGK